jgi:hypothetical protein
MMMMMAPTGGRLGLGHDSSADVFDEFRKRSSYNFIKEVSRRDTSAGPKCYNCGKVNQDNRGSLSLSLMTLFSSLLQYGHFAKTCEAHLGKP